MAIRAKISQILQVKESAGRIALAFAVGVFIGMSPLLGLHTVLGIAVAWQFRLNKLVTLVGVYITNPWTIVPIYSFGTWGGARLLGVRQILPAIDWNEVTLRTMATDLSHLLLPFIVGTFLLGALSSVIGYFVIYVLIRRARG